MSKIPGSGQVDRALKTVKREVKNSLKQINQSAAKLLSRGDYSGAESLVEVARTVDGFQAEIESLRAKWKEVTGSFKNGSKGDVKKTPLWEYYKPILKALDSLGGRALTPNLISSVEPIIEAYLKPGDMEILSNGRPRWQVMLRKTRKHMVKEGYLEPTTGQEWRITTVGRKTASQGG